MASAAPHQETQPAASHEAGKPADETTKKIALEEDDEFEDFPVEGA